MRWAARVHVLAIHPAVLVAVTGYVALDVASALPNARPGHRSAQVEATSELARILLAAEQVGAMWAPVGVANGAGVGG